MKVSNECSCACMYVCMCVCVYVCIYVCIDAFSYHIKKLYILVYLCDIKKHELKKIM